MGASTYYRAVILGDAPVAYYTLSETSGSVAADLSGNGRNGTYGTSGLTLGAAGILANGDPGGKAVTSAATGPIAQLPSGAAPATGAQPWTLECWVNPQAAALDGNYHELVGFGTAGTTKQMAALYLHSGGLIFTGYAADTNSALAPVTAGQTYHCVATYDGAVVRLYLNGVQVTTLTTTLAIVAGGQWIGRSVSFNNQDLLAATIAHVAFYSTTLTAAQVATHYQAGITPSNYHVAIGGKLVTAKTGSLRAENQIGQRSQGSVGVWSPLGTVWSYGTQVQLYDDTGALAYSGYTTKDKATKPGGARQGTGYLEHDVQLMDNAYRADKRRVFKYYLGQTAGYIVNDLFGSYLAPEGVTKTATSVATGPTITEARWSGNKSVGEALTWLCQQAGYWWQIDLNGVLWFQPYGGVPAPFVLDGSQADAMQDISVEFGNDMYVNKQFVKGAFAEKGSRTNQLHETFHGNGTTRSFTLSFPISHIYQVLLNGIDVTAKSLTKGQTGGQFYYATGDPILAQDPSQTILQSGDTVDVYYTGRYPVISSAQNPSLITAQRQREGGGTGLVESSYSNSKVRTLPAAFQIAAALLAHYGQDTTILTFSTRIKGLLAGQMLSVNLPDFNLNNKQMLISGVEIDDQGPDGYAIWYRVTAVGSPVESAQWQTYWQNLMNQSSDPSDFTDTNDTSLALLSATTVTRTPTVTVTPKKVIGAVCGVSGASPPGMICGQWTVC